MIKKNPTKAESITALVKAGFTKGVTDGEFNKQLTDDTWLCVWFEEADEPTQVYLDNISISKEFQLSMKDISVILMFASMFGTAKGGENEPE